MVNGYEYFIEGLSDIWWMWLEVLFLLEFECYYIDFGRCMDEELDLFFDGMVIVKDWIVVGREKKGKKVDDEKLKFVLLDFL